MDDHKHTEHTAHDSHRQSSSHKKNETLTVSKMAVWQGISAILGVLLIVSLFTGGFGIGADETTNGGNNPTVPNNPQQPSQPRPPAEVVDVSADDDPVLGDEDAEVTLIEFSDFQCPFCARFYTQSLPTIKSKYIDTGEAKLVFRDFPLSFHPYAQISSEAAECVRDQTDDATFFEYHDLLFENVNSWATGSGADAFVTLAGRLDADIDNEELAECIESGKFESEVQEDFAAGSAAGVSGTPTVFVNGKAIVGACPASLFDQAIAAELAGEDWSVQNCQFFS